MYDTPMEEFFTMIEATGEVCPSFCSNHFSTFEHVYFYFTIYFLNKISQKKMISDIPIPQARKKNAENNIGSHSEVVLRL